MTDAAKDSALSQIVALMDSHGLSVRDIKTAWQNRNKTEDSKTALSKGEVVLRLFSYIGGAFIFAGLGTFISMIWSDISSLPRVIITLGSGFVAFTLGLLFAKNPRLEKAATPCNIVAFVLQPTGLFVLLHEYFGGGNIHLGAMLVFGALTLQQILTFAATKRTAPLLFSVLYALGFILDAAMYFTWSFPFTVMTTGLSLLCLSIDLLKRPRHRDLTPWFFILSLLMFFSGLYYYTGHSLYDLTILSVMLGLLGIAVANNSRTLYSLSIIYTVLYLMDGPGGGWEVEGWRHYLSTLVAGSSILLTGHWLRKAGATTTPLWFFTGMSYALGGAYGLVYHTPLEILYLGVCAFGIYASLLLKSRAALAASILSLVSFISYYSHLHFENVIGWPVLLILLGLMMLGAGVFFVRLSRKIESSR